MNTYLTPDDVLTTHLPARQTVQTRPGAHEELTVTLWNKSGRGWVRARGWYTVYCGMGNAHRVWIDEREELLPLDEAVGAGVAALVGRSLHDITSLLVEWALDGWACDCDYHDDYPHEPGRLPGCSACEDECHCTPDTAECVWEGHNQ